MQKKDLFWMFFLLCFSVSCRNAGKDMMENPVTPVAKPVAKPTETPMAQPDPVAEASPPANASGSLGEPEGSGGHAEVQDTGSQDHTTSKEEAHMTSDAPHVEPVVHVEPVAQPTPQESQHEAMLDPSDPSLQAAIKSLRFSVEESGELLTLQEVKAKKELTQKKIEIVEQRAAAAHSFMVRTEDVAKEPEFQEAFLQAHQLGEAIAKKLHAILSLHPDIFHTVIANAMRALGLDPATFEQAKRSHPSFEEKILQAMIARAVLEGFDSPLDFLATGSYEALQPIEKLPVSEKNLPDGREAKIFSHQVAYKILDGLHKDHPLLVWDQHAGPRSEDLQLLGSFHLHYKKLLYLLSSGISDLQNVRMAMSEPALRNRESLKGFFSNDEIQSQLMKLFSLSYALHFLHYAYHYSCKLIQIDPNTKISEVQVKARYVNSFTSPHDEVLFMIWPGYVLKEIHHPASVIYKN